MAHTRRTLKLNKKWDIALDGAGRIALATGAEATAQNVANEARLFTKDAYFNQDRGIPYFITTLGQKQNFSVLRAHLRRAALSVADVKEVIAIQINNFDPDTRKLTADIQFTTVEGQNNDTIRTSL